MLLLLLALACAVAPTPISPRCGDGVVDLDEECDDGAANDDATADACRSACLLPSCGDAVVDAEEGCDDGGRLGGDGCDGACVAETGALEVEPNESPDEATPVEARAHGALPDEDDVDCWSFDVTRCGAVSVTQAEPCGAAITLALHGPDGALLAAGASDADGCATLDPADQPGARWVEEGTWSVCAQSVSGGVASYALDVSTAESAGLDAGIGEDLDADGEPDSCDLDRDGDGVDDATDTCTEVSNGPETTLTLTDEGYVQTWLGAGPFTGDASTDACRPAEEARVGEDATITPTVGDPAGEDTWQAILEDDGWLNLYTYFGVVSEPREAYALVYLYSDSARDLTLAVGADDGVFAWWNGEKVIDIAGCQGVTPDQFQSAVSVTEGWNTLLLKVRDQGGGWGLTARLLDSAGAAVTDLQPGLAADGSWIPDQTDTDGDGLGDVCDDE